MRIIPYKTTLVLVVGLLQAFCTPIRADFFKEAAGFVTDPIGLRRASSELSDSLERTLVQLKDLEGVANADIKNRLEQIRSIMKEVHLDVNGTIQAALASMRAIEADVNQHAIDLIYRTQCATEVVLMSQFQRAFAETISNVIKANPGINFLGVRVIDLAINNVVIDDPDRAYWKLRELRFAALKDLKETSDAYTIVSTYQNLERYAWFTRCHYIQNNGGLASRFTEEINELERLSTPWFEVVKPKM